MEYISQEGAQPYIPYERRMLIDLVRHTHGQPVLSVGLADGLPDALERYGINHGFRGNETHSLFVKIPNGDVSIFDLSDRESLYVVGRDEVASYTMDQLYGWRTDAGSPQKLDMVTRLLTVAQELDVDLGRVDIAEELEGIWTAITELKSEDRQAKVDMLNAVIESSLSDRLANYMKDVVSGANSLSEIIDHQLVLAYVEALTGTYPNIEEQLALLHELAKDAQTLEK